MHKHSLGKYEHALEAKCFCDANCVFHARSRQCFCLSRLHKVLRFAPRHRRTKEVATTCAGVSFYLVFGHGAHNKGAHHSRERPHTVGDAHEDAGISRSNVQVVHVET